MEKKVKVDSGETPEVVYELRQKVENVRNKLEVSIFGAYIARNRILKPQNWPKDRMKSMYYRILTKVRERATFTSEDIAP